MRFQVLGCAGGSVPGRLPTSFLINENVAIDAGALTSALSPSDQKKVEHVVLSHSHLDHIGSLPFLLDNCFAGQTHPTSLYASSESMADLRAHLFNDRIWPDFTSLRTKKSVALELIDIAEERPFQAGGVTLAGTRMEHPVPCLGFLCSDDSASVFIAGDTGSYVPVKRATERVEGLAAIVIEVSWPNRLRQLANLTGHLVPAMIEEAWPLHPTAKVLITHIKPFFHDEVVGELARLGLDGLQVLEDGMVFDW